VRPETKRLGGTLKPERRKRETEVENSSCRGRNLSTRNQVGPSGKHKTLAQPRLWHEQPDSRSKRARRTGDAKDHVGQNPRRETGARVEITSEQYHRYSALKNLERQERKLGADQDSTAGVKSDRENKIHRNGLSGSHEEISGRKKRIEGRTKYDAESEQAIDESSRGSTSTTDVEGFR
jgi:hypothetical protein